MMYRKLSLPKSGVYLYESIHKKEDYVAGHYHDDFQILYALDGNGTITMDENTYPFKKDNVVLIVPNSTHSIRTNSKLTVLVLAFSIHKLKSGISKDLFHELETSSTYFELDAFSASELRRLLRKLLYEQNNSFESFRATASPIFLLEIVLILARLNRKSIFSNANEMRSFRIREYLQSNYFENIRAEIIASKFGISSRHMNSIFKDSFNETPMQYLQSIRITRAKSLLSETDKEIVSICFEVGYESLSTFYRTFKNVAGVSPYQFRKANT